ncbi:MAG: hypothetical protein ACM3VX_10190 [Bacteroidota bacterium]
MRMFYQKVEAVVTLRAVASGHAAAVSPVYAGNDARFPQLYGVPAPFAGITRPNCGGYRTGGSAQIERRVLGLGSVAGRTFSTEYPLILPAC